MTSRSEILAQVRSRQAAGDNRPLRIILEFGAPRDPAALAAEISRQLGIAVEAMRLSQAHGEVAEGADDGLANFVAVTVPGVTAADVADAPFELGYAIADATGAITAEPELGTDFYFAPRATELEGLEDFPPGCWVDEAGDPTQAQPLWAVKKIKAFDAWQVSPKPGGHAKGEGIKVFQPDTGVADHVELEAGMIGTALAYDFIDNKPGAIDPLNASGNPGHGTGTASVVASRHTSNGKMAGSAPLATLVPLRAVTRVVVFDHGRVAAAVDYARRSGANVITMSLGGAWSSALRAAIGRAIADGVIVLAAAGNCVKTVVWPARYEEVIAVAGFNVADQPWIGSCRGEAVDITAPAEFVPRANRAPVNGGSPTDVRGGQGTSFAVALTAGVAALWLGHHGVAAVKMALGPGQTVQDLFVALLKATSWRPAGPWQDDKFGAGIVDAKALLDHPLQMPDTVEGADAVAAAPLHSLETALAEAVPASLEGMAEISAGAPLSKRYAAELSHLALAKRKRETAGGALEAVSADAPPSETLTHALAASGRGDLAEALRD